MSQNLVQPDIPLWVRGWSLWVPLPPSHPSKRYPKPKPKWINLNERSHWGGRNGKTALWRTAARVAAEEAEIPILVLAWVQALFHFGDAGRRDVHNYVPTVKACVDGFTDAGLWVDDQDGILVGPDCRRAAADFVRTQPGNAKAKGIEFRIFEVTSGH